MDRRSRSIAAYGIPNIYQGKSLFSNPDFSLETYLATLQVNRYRYRLEADKDEFIERFDALDLFRAVAELTNNLTEMKLENSLLRNYLKKNDSRFSQAKMNIATSRRVSGDTSSITRSNRGTLSRFSTTKTSLFSRAQPSTAPSSRAGRREYKLNYHFKIDLANKAYAQVDTDLQEYKIQSLRNIKVLNAKIEEAHITREELMETVSNFEIHFFRDKRDALFLHIASEPMIVRKFRKFLNPYLRNGHNILSKLALGLIAVQENCHDLRSELVSKSHLGAVLCSVDFEILRNKRNALLNELEEKNLHVAGLKSVTGRAALELAEESSVQMDLEAKSKRIQQKTHECIKRIGLLEKETLFVEDINNRDVRRYKDLNEQLSRFEAPSVEDYIGAKAELTQLEKEEKMLKRKIYISLMKQSNLKKTLERRNIDVL